MANLWLTYVHAMIFECFQMFHAEDTEDHGSSRPWDGPPVRLQIDLAQGATVLAAKIHAVITRCQVVELKEIVEPLATHSDTWRANKRAHSFDVSAFFHQ